MYEIYQVDMTQTLDDVSKRLNVDYNTLKEINGYDDNYLVMEGSYIIIPKRTNIDMDMDDNFMTYTVQNGDTIIEIARKYGLDYKQLLALNGLDKEEYIYPGQSILIPNKNVMFWITGDNDTLNDVANLFATNLESIISSNDNIYLRPDQMLIIKKKD